MPTELVRHKLDHKGQPAVVQAYHVPMPRNDKYRRHDQSVYSLWQHFVLCCSVINDTEAVRLEKPVLLRSFADSTKRANTFIEEERLQVFYNLSNGIALPNSCSYTLAPFEQTTTPHDTATPINNNNNNNKYIDKYIVNIPPGQLSSNSRGYGFPTFIPESEFAQKKINAVEIDNDHLSRSSLQDYNMQQLSYEKSCRQLHSLPFLHQQVQMEQQMRKAELMLLEQQQQHLHILQLERQQRQLQLLQLEQEQQKEKNLIDNFDSLGMDIALQSLLDDDERSSRPLETDKDASTRRSDAIYIDNLFFKNSDFTACQEIPDTLQFNKSEKSRFFDTAESVVEPTGTHASVSIRLQHAAQLGSSLLTDKKSQSFFY